MAVGQRDVDAAFVGIYGFLAVSGEKVSVGEDTVGVALVISFGEVSLEQIDHFRVIAAFLILFRQAEHHHSVVRICREHLLEYLCAVLHDQFA